MSEDQAIEILQRGGFDVDINKSRIWYPYRYEITDEQDEAVRFLVDECQHTVIPSEEEY